MPEATPSDHTNPAFDEAFEAIRALLASAIRDDVQTRHRIGLLLCKVKTDRKAYGDFAVERLAEKLGMGAPTLYRYATAAEHWPTQEFEAIMARTNGEGQPLSWSHLVSLARVPVASERRRLASYCLAEGWSVRDLTQHIDEYLVMSVPGKGDGAAREHTARLALVDGIKRASRVAAHLSAFQETLACHSSDEERDQALLLSASAAYQNLRSQIDSILAFLEEPDHPMSHRRIRLPEHVYVDTTPKGVGTHGPRLMSVRAPLRLGQAATKQGPSTSRPRVDNDAAGTTGEPPPQRLRARGHRS